MHYEAQHLGPRGSLSYRWRLTGRTSGNVYRLVETSVPTLDLLLPGAGVQYRIVCTVLEGTRRVGEVWIDQDTAARRIARGAFDSQDAQAFSELADELRGYVVASAAGTGPQGITALFLASVLRIEIENTPVLPLMSPRAARDREIARSAEALAERAAGEAVDPADLDRSIGVGQIRPSTAAMVDAEAGGTPWVEQNRDDRGPARTTIQNNYRGLSVAQQRSIHTMLAWPKSNIDTAARLLARLKNRSHRYPGLARADFGTAQRAAEIVATEYNQGGTSTPAAAARPSWYGSAVWAHMQDTAMQSVFPNT
ncbi:hypothetical protein [Cellulomonas septica]|uniref:Uncharacterized protein n=1 Tax=Cellulomonas septica TaxID=285080 RepID=A0ABX1JYS7_9CELL|nr:hypothetical protein [Cellulomonas septica]NKY38487.1 hypothetical protein [Cellulomonas septica]